MYGEFGLASGVYEKIIGDKALIHEAVPFSGREMGSQVSSLATRWCFQFCMA